MFPELLPPRELAMDYPFEHCHDAIDANHARPKRSKTYVFSSFPFVFLSFPPLSLSLLSVMRPIFIGVILQIRRRPDLGCFHGVHFLVILPLSHSDVCQFNL